MKIRRDIFSFRNRVVVIIVGVSLGMVSLLYTNNMAKRLKEKEQHLSLIHISEPTRPY